MNSSIFVHIVLREALQTVFSHFGPIVDLKIKRNIRHRGQAFISFEDTETATRALTALRGAPLFDKMMDVQYAREQSFCVSEKQGTLEEHKAKRKIALQERAHQLEEERVKRAKQKAAAAEQLPPNAILFVQNLPSDVTNEVLSKLFTQFSGFKEVRTVPGKPDIAFVEYVDEVTSAVAKQGLHGFRLGENEIKISFAKK